MSAEVIQQHTIKIKYLEPGLQPVKEFTGGDWIDLRAAETVKLKAGEFRMIRLGVAMELPVGYEALLAARSSTFKYFGIIPTNGIGIIDETYCGDSDEWHFPVYATRDATIKKNDRVCQFRIIPHQPRLILETVPELGNQNRGGLGSTGVQ